MKERTRWIYNLDLQKKLSRLRVIVQKTTALERVPKTKERFPVCLTINESRSRAIRNILGCEQVQMEQRLAIQKAPRLQPKL